MGIHVCVVDTETGNDVDGWDWIRYAGDRDIPQTIFTSPYVTKVSAALEETVYRPKDIEAFVKTMHQNHEYNHERWELLGQLLKDNPNYWLYFSY